MYFSLCLSLLCLLGLARGQSSITADPSASIAVGENVTITCNSGTGALTPALRINGNPIPNDHPRVRIVGSSSGVRVFEFSFVTKGDDGTTFSCTNVDGSLTLEALFGPEIQANIGDITVDNGGSATVSFTVDANPAITSDNITVTIGGQSVGFTASIDGNMVNLTLYNLQTTGQYSVSVANSVEMKSFIFQVNVVSVNPTTSTQPSGSSGSSGSSSVTTAASASSSSSSSVSASFTMTRPSSSAIATPGATNQPTNSAVGVQASIFLLPLLIIFIVFVMY